MVQWVLVVHLIRGPLDVRAVLGHQELLLHLCLQVIPVCPGSRGFLDCRVVQQHHCFLVVLEHLERLVPLWLLCFLDDLVRLVVLVPLGYLVVHWIQESLVDLVVLWRLVVQEDLVGLSRVVRSVLVLLGGRDFLDVLVVLVDPADQCYEHERLRWSVRWR